MGEVAKNFAKKFLHSSALFRKYFARFTKEVQLVKTFQFKSKNWTHRQAVTRVGIGTDLNLLTAGGKLIPRL